MVMMMMMMVVMVMAMAMAMVMEMVMVMMMMWDDGSGDDDDGSDGDGDGDGNGDDDDDRSGGDGDSDGDSDGDGDGNGDDNDSSGSDGDGDSDGDGSDGDGDGNGDDDGNGDNDDGSDGDGDGDGNGDDDDDRSGGDGDGNGNDDDGSDGDGHSDSDGDGDGDGDGNGGDDDDDDDDVNGVISFFSISGTAGDSLRYHENKNFSTNFQDNNHQEPTNCPQHFLGAWWHDRCNPLQSNLNGGYFKKNSVLWLSLKGYRNSLKSTSMKIRSVTGEPMHCSRAENNKSVESGTNSQGFSSAWRWIFVPVEARASILFWATCFSLIQRVLLCRYWLGLLHQFAKKHDIAACAVGSGIATQSTDDLLVDETADQWRQTDFDCVLFRGRSNEQNCCPLDSEELLCWFHF